MRDITAELNETGSILVAAGYRPPPPPVIRNRLYVRCISDGDSVSALTLTIPSLSRRQAAELAETLQKAAEALVSPSTIGQAGSADDPGVVIDLMPVMAK